MHTNLHTEIHTSVLTCMPTPTDDSKATLEDCQLVNDQDVFAELMLVNGSWMGLPAYLTGKVLFVCLQSPSSLVRVVLSLVHVMC